MDFPKKKREADKMCSHQHKLSQSLFSYCQNSEFDRYNGLIPKSLIFINHLNFVNKSLRIYVTSIYNGLITTKPPVGSIISVRSQIPMRSSNYNQNLDNNSNTAPVMIRTYN